MDKKLESIRDMLKNHPELKDQFAAETRRLEKSGEAAGEEARLAAARSVFGVALTPEELRTSVTGTQELTPEDLDKTAGGTAITAGGYNFNYRLHHPTACPSCLQEGKFTGVEDEQEHFFGLWSEHVGQFHCKDCNTYWWVSGHTE